MTVSMRRFKLRRIQSALLSWFIECTTRRTLVLQVDDLHRADESSVSFLAALSREAVSHRILIIATLRRREPISAPAAVQAFRRLSGRIRLHRLKEKDTLRLTESLFGDVPNTDRLARWMQELSGGNPLQCIELARHLVDRGIVRYAEGIWVLPAELSTGELPRSLAEAMDARIAALGALARALAEIARDPFLFQETGLHSGQVRRIEDRTYGLPCMEFLS